MTYGTVAVVLIALVASMLAASLIVLGYNRIRQGRRSSSRKTDPEHGSPGAQGRAGGERRASAPAELMQAIVQREMASDPAFTGRSLDFGSAPDGSLEIWLDGRAYAAVEQIPDTRLRELIARAVEEFNRGAPAAP